MPRIQNCCVTCGRLTWIRYSGVRAVPEHSVPGTATSRLPTGSSEPPSRLRSLNSAPIPACPILPFSKRCRTTGWIPAATQWIPGKAEIGALCALRESAQVHAVRQRFSFLGECCSLFYRSEHLQADVEVCNARILSLEAERARLQAEVARWNGTEEQLKLSDARISSLEAEAARRSPAEQQFRARAAHRTSLART